MPLVFIRHLGNNVAFVHSLDAVDPGYGRPGGGADPGYGLPEWARPGHDLPWAPGHPGNRPPGSGNPAFPDNTLPIGKPPVVAAGETLVLVRDPEGVWHYASIDASTPPPKPLPPGPPDYVTGQPVPPVATPT